MKSRIFLCILLLQQMYPYVLNQRCLPIFQMAAATSVLCRQHRGDKELWQKVIDCHRPISEKFMRESNEARCPNPKVVEDPTDTNYSIQDVFLNFCGLVDGGVFNQLSAGVCMLVGQRNPFIMSQTTEVAAVRATWGNDVPCNIGKCIIDLGII